MEFALHIPVMEPADRVCTVYYKQATSKMQRIKYKSNTAPFYMDVVFPGLYLPVY